MNRTEKIEGIIYWESVAAQATARAKLLRASLENEAREEYVREGTAPAWKAPMAGATLPLTAAEYRVTDERAFAKWVQANRPEHIQTVTRVYDSFQKVFLADMLTRGDVPCTDQGEIVPGVEYVPGGIPKSIQIRPKPGVRQQMEALAEQALESFAPSEEGISQ